MGGFTSREGRVEVCRNGRWRAVCGDGWDQEQAGLLCCELGYLSYGRLNSVAHTMQIIKKHPQLILQELRYDCLIHVESQHSTVV